MADDPYMRLQGFLRDLKRLTKKYGVEVGGCGSCGSPWVSTAKKGEVLLEHLTWCKPCNKYGPYANHMDCDD